MCRGFCYICAQSPRKGGDYHDPLDQEGQEDPFDQEGVHHVVSSLLVSPYPMHSGVLGRSHLSMVIGSIPIRGTMRLSLGAISESPATPCGRQERKKCLPSLSRSPLLREDSKSSSST